MDILRQPKVSQGSHKTNPLQVSGNETKENIGCHVSQQELMFDDSWHHQSKEIPELRIT